MANSDGSVEVRITGSIDSSLRSSVSAANAEIGGLANTTTISAAKMADALKSVGGDLSKIKPEMLGMGSAAVSASSAAVPAIKAAETATHGLNLATATASREYIVLAHELLQGNFSRIPGSLMVVAERTGGLHTVTAGLTAGMVASAGVAALLVGGLGYLAYQDIQTARETERLAQSFKNTNRESMATGEAVSYQLRFLSQIPGSTRAAATGFLNLAAQNASWTPQLVNQVGQLMPAFINLYGEKAPQAAGRLVASLSELSVNGFQRMDRELLNLSPEEYEQIENMIRMGDTAEATSRILQRLSQNAGIYIKSTGDQIYDISQKIEQLRKLFPAATTAGLVENSPQLRQMLGDLANLRGKDRQAGDQSYKNELDAAGDINRSLNQRKTLLDSIARLEKDAADAARRGDKIGAGVFADALKGEQQKLRDLRDRARDDDYRQFATAEDAKAALFKSGSAQRIRIAEGELAKAKSLYGQDSVEYNHALAKVNEEKRASAATGEREAAKEGREAAREAKQAAEERLRAEQEVTQGFREGSGERVDAALKEYRLAISLFGEFSSQGKASFGEYTRAVVSFNHEQGRSAEDTARDRIRDDEEVFTEVSRNLDDLLSKNRITGEQFIAQSVAVENARSANTLAWLATERTALQVIGDETRSVDKAIEDENRRHQKQMADDARRGADAQIAELHRVNAQYLSAQDAFISSYLSGQTSLLDSAKQALAQFGVAEIQADARMWAERALLALQGQSAINASEKGGMLFHLFAEAIKTGETATQTGEQVATVAAGETAKTGAVAASQAAQVGIVAAGSAAKSTVAAAGDSKSILNAAYVSAAEAYKSVMEAVPPPFNLVLAPLAAAGTFAAVAAWDLVSAEGGEYMVRGNGVSYRLHDREAVMPAHVADPMRNFFERGGDTNSVNNGGDINLHMPVTINGSPNKIDLEDALRTHRSAIYRWAQNEHANGNLRKLALGR
jgi:hypothetical protein